MVLLAHGGGNGRKQLSIVPGATRLFEEPGTLDQVVDLASRWFEAHLTEARPS